MIAFIRNLSVPLLVLFGGFAYSEAFPTGVATGDFCRASTEHINASGTPFEYQCHTPEIADVMTAGVYCSN